MCKKLPLVASGSCAITRSCCCSQSGLTGIDRITQRARSHDRSDRQTKRIVDEKVVVDAAAFGELQLRTYPTEHVMICADLVQLGIRPIEQHLQDDIVGERPYFSGAILAE